MLGKQVAGAPLLAFLAILFPSFLLSQDPNASPTKPIPKGSRVFLSPIDGGFETYLAAGIMKKKVPLVIVNSREKAEYELTGIAETEKAGWARMLFMGTDSSREQAGVKLLRVDSGEIVFAYAVHKGTSVRGKQSAAESCAKHLKERIEKGK